MMDEFHLTPLSANADSADLLEALGPLEESPAESQFCVFRSGRERFCLPVLDVEEVLAAMHDLAAQGTDILTLGQYLQPTREHLPIVRFVHPDEFAEYKKLGEQMGFGHVESGPLVRSSYHAFVQEAAAHV